LYEITWQHETAAAPIGRPGFDQLQPNFLDAIFWGVVRPLYVK